MLNHTLVTTFIYFNILTCQDLYVHIIICRGLYPFLEFSVILIIFVSNLIFHDENYHRDTYCNVYDVCNAMEMWIQLDHNDTKAFYSAMSSHIKTSARVTTLLSDY